MLQKATRKSYSKEGLVFSENEIRFLEWAGTELTYKEIAQEMCVSERTLENYRVALCEKLSLKNRVELALYAVRNGITNTQREK